MVKLAVDGEKTTLTVPVEYGGGQWPVVAASKGDSIIFSFSYKRDSKNHEELSGYLFTGYRSGASYVGDFYKKTHWSPNNANARVGGPPNEKGRFRLKLLPDGP